MLPEKFKERMKALLKDEYSDFEHALLGEGAIRAFRVNTLKSCTDTVLKNIGLDISKIPYCEQGFIINSSAEGIGNSPFHHAGHIYMQDPGAMATVEAVTITEGMKICDLCAAPGGKTTQAAAKIGDTGFILANEFVPKRAKILLSNIERLGIKNAAVTSCDTSELAIKYPDFFDLVIADAPCSGEGMFRKGDAALLNWSEENIKACAKRQINILENGAKMVTFGGYLLYSTCTYAIEENEAVIDAFLKKHPEFSLCEVSDAVKSSTSDGIVFEGASSDLTLCRRFYPHKNLGEGQFIALLQKDFSGDLQTKGCKSKDILPSKKEISIIEDFFEKHLIAKPCGKIIKYGENLVLISHACPIPERAVFSAGVLLGEIRGSIFVPSHQFFSAYGNLFKIKIELTEAQAVKYLRGEELDTDSSLSGFCTLLYLKAPLGGGKISNGKIKNHYPKGLRLMG